MMPSQFLGNVYLPQKNLSLRFLLLGMTLYGMEYPFGQLESTVLVVSPLNFLCAPSLLTEGVELEKEKALALQALLSNSQNTSVLSTLL